MCAFAAEPQILRTKLYPPRLPEIVSRERLLVELEKAGSSKLTAIVAGAGYGKSTLAAEFLHRQGRPFVWYQLEESDSDLSVFLSYLIAGLKNLYPQFGEATLSHLASTPNVAEQSRSILSSFVTDLDELIGEELFISFDDFHQVNDSVQIREAMGFLLDHMLPNLHFVILSRSSLSLPLANLKARRELLELQENNLRFTSQETAKLFRDVFRMPLEEEDIDALSESTEGWISGLVLFYLALKDKSGEEASRAIRESGLSLPDVFDYLSEATYENQPQAVRDFLARTSILSRMSPAFCDELLCVNDSQVILSYLISERLFTIPLDDQGDWYRYHHRLQAFLRKVLQDTLSPDEIRDLHRKAAALWEKQDEPEEALRHYREAKDYDKAAEVLEGLTGPAMLAGRVSFFDREIYRLPEDVFKNHPTLTLYSTMMAGMLGDADGVVAGARAAAEEFEARGLVEEQVLSLFRMAEGCAGVPRFDEAGEALARVRAMMDPDSPLWCEVFATESFILTAIGKAGDADPSLEEALKRVDEIEDEGIKINALAWCVIILFLQGRFNRAIEVFLKDAELIESTQMTSTLVPFIYGLITRAYAFLDRLDEAIEKAGESVSLGERDGISPMVFLSRASRAVARACRGESERAHEDISIATAMCEHYNPDASPTMFTEWFLAETCLLIGDKTTAMKHLKRFETMIAKWGEAQYLAKILQIAISLHDLGPARAEAEIGEAIAILEESGYRLAFSYAYSFLLSLKLAAGKTEEARQILEAYVSEFGEDIILRTFSDDMEHFLPFFTDLFMEGRHLEFMERVYGIGGTRSVPYLKKLESSGRADIATKAGELLQAIAPKTIEPLVIKMLGPFQVSRGGRSLSADDWRSKKALTAFKYLTANRDRGFVPRDVIMELLWPEAPLESAQKSLNTTLSSLRKTLEPEAGRGESSYLISRGDTLRLELGARGTVDLELFRERLAQATKARQIGDFDLYFHTLSEAADLYAGDFCAEDLYEDWCSQEREAIRSDYMETLVNMATEHLRRGEDAEALQRLEEALRKDPGREELYRKQMIIHSQMGNRPGIEEAYRRCCQYIQENYDASPSRETAELYSRLRQQ